MKKTSRESPGAASKCNGNYLFILLAAFFSGSLEREFEIMNRARFVYVRALTLIEIAVIVRAMIFFGGF